MAILVASFRYWNDPEALQKFGRAMGVGPSGEGAAAAGGEHEEAEEEGGEEGEYEDESVIHHTASVGDVEVSKSIPTSITAYSLLFKTRWSKSNHFKFN